LSSTDWNTFNNKQNALSFGNLTGSPGGVLSVSGGTGAVIGSGSTVSIAQATSGQSGFLSSTDWNTFNNKQNTITNPVTATPNGTTNRVAKFTSGTNIGNSTITDDGTNVSATGNITAAAFFQSSSRELKEAIVKFDRSAIDIINQTTIVEFVYKNDPDKRLHYGFIAEDTPIELSTVDRNTMDTNSVLGILIKAVQELDARVKQLENNG
jgi:hypothetical protein